MNVILVMLFASVFIFANPFPTISEKSLSNKTVNIPNNQHRQLLILGFDMNSSDPMNEWASALGLMNEAPPIHWVQMPVIGGVPPFVDGFIKRGMKKSVDKSFHAHYVPYFGDKKDDILKSLQGTTQLEDAVTPFIVITNPDGHMAYMLQGLPTTKNIKMVIDKIKSPNQH